MSEQSTPPALYDHERDMVEERSWYRNGCARFVRREDVARDLWEKLPYRRLVGPWEPRCK